MKGHGQPGMSNNKLFPWKMHMEDNHRLSILILALDSLNHITTLRTTLNAGHPGHRLVIDIVICIRKPVLGHKLF